MQAFKQNISAFVILIIIFSVSSPCPEAFGGSCASGVAVPPFLGSSSTPNLLILIDNSASMYDLAYVNDSNPEGCYDDTYQSIQDYAGYFEPDKWYAYNVGSEKFAQITDAAAGCGEIAGGTVGVIARDMQW